MRIYRSLLFRLALSVITLGLPFSVVAEDIAGIVEHPLLKRYPGQEIRWQQIENYMPYSVPVGPVTGYRTISDMVTTEGRVTRTFYRLQGSERSYSELYKNYLDALRAEDFEILANGFSPDRKGNAVGSRSWIEVAYRANPTTKPGEVGKLYSGTSSSGGAGSIVARRDRVAGEVFVVLTVEQHSANYVGALVDIIEVAPAETGLVLVDPEAIGSDIAEYGRVILDGIFFDFDQAALQERSGQTLAAIAAFLQANTDKRFYVVGHTDSVGTFAYNAKLSADRARAVVAALKQDYGIANEQLQGHGVGPLAPQYSNGSELGREKNRRVELVEWQRTD